MEAIFGIVVAILAVYAVVLVFLFISSSDFWTGKTIIKNPVVAALFWTPAVIAIFLWSELWGQYAWPAFFGLLLLGYIVITTAVSMAQEKREREKERS